MSVTDQPWRADALCHGASYIAWTADSPDAETVKFAREICSFCTVADACLRDAMQDRTASGIRAGLTEKQRRNLRPPTPSDLCGRDRGLGRHRQAAERNCPACQQYQVDRDAMHYSTREWTR